MSLLLLSFVSLTITALSLRLMAPLAQHLDLLDKPCTRKQHKGAVPLIGGVSVFIGVLFAMMLAFEPILEVRLFVVASALMVFIGVLDDKFDLSVRLRVVGQVLSASVIVIGGELYIANLGDLFGFGIVELGAWGIPFTYLAILAAMNAYNMVDGIDGLLGGLGLIAFAGVALLTFDYAWSLPFFAATLIACALLPYLVCNLQLIKRCYKVFMGDAGSMFVGLSIVWLLALATQGHNDLSPAFRPVTALWLVAIPVMDMVAIVIKRLAKKRSPFKPDRDHVHHILISAGLTSKQTLMVIIGVASILAAVGLLGEYFQVPGAIMFILFLFAFVVYCQVLRSLCQTSKH